MADHHTYISSNLAGSEFYLNRPDEECLKEFLDGLTDKISAKALLETEICLESYDVQEYISYNNVRKSNGTCKTYKVGLCLIIPTDTVQSALSQE